MAIPIDKYVGSEASSRQVVTIPVPGPEGPRGPAGAPGTVTPELQALVLQADMYANEAMIDAERATQSAQEAANSAANVRFGYATRAELPTLTAGDNGRVVNVTNDPTAANNGAWRWDGSAWVQTADRTTQLSTTLAEVAGTASPTVAGNYIEIDQDAIGNVAFAVHADGTRQFLRTQVSGLSVTDTGPGGAVIDGAFSRSSVYTEWTQQLQPPFDAALLVEIDDNDRVGRAVYADGTVFPHPGPVPGTSFVLAEQISLPNGAQGQNPNGGFTCTGLARITSGKWRDCWVVGNDGRAYEGTQGGVAAPFLCSIVILSPDMRRIIRENPCNTPAFPGIESIQGVAWDSSDDTIWFVDKTNKTIRHTSFEGAKLPDEIVVAHTPNGIAYRADQDALYSPGEGTSSVYLMSCANGAVIQTLTGIHAQADQLFFEAQTDRLWATIGANGVDGQALVYAAATMSQTAAYTLVGSQAIEGIQYDSASRTLTTVNDGAFHLSANPPLALACRYTFQ